MKKISLKQLLLFFFLAYFGNLFSQKYQPNDILLEIAGEKITVQDFLNVYQKNNIKGEKLDKDAVNEYLELFINFKLKVREALDLKMDTVLSFKNELNGYRKQLVQPYLTDKEVTEKLIEEAYDRMKYDIRASHILIKVSQNANPKDTLAAYKKIMEIRKKALAGEPFEKLAREYSEDPSAKDQPAGELKQAVKGNGGDLGYFSAFSMVYPFESAAYNTKVGEISMPVRTQYGYHLIKVTEKRKSLGTFQVAHIMIAAQPNPTPEDTMKWRNKIFEIYELIKKGDSFEELAKQYSDDKGSGAKGGVLPPLTSSRIVPEFSIAVAKLEKIGDISEPVKTSFGWHIIKLLDKKELDPFETMKNEIKNRVAKDIRSSKGKDVLVARVKATYSFKEFPETLKEFNKVVDSSIFQAKWNIESAKGLNKTMFTIGNKKYTQEDFAKYLVKTQTRRTKEDIEGYLLATYKKFVDESCVNYEDENLENTNAEFKALLQEYKDGILLFELTDNKVWTKAIKDSVGMVDFYNKNKNNYMWGERLDATIYSCMNANVAKETRKLLKSADKKGYKDADILKMINKDSQLNLTIENAKFSKGDNPIIDSIPWVVGLTKDFKSGKYIVFVNVRQVLKPEPKLISEIRGQLTADYQQYLEQEWIKDLRQKYPVIVHKDVLKTLYE